MECESPLSVRGEAIAPIATCCCVGGGVGGGIGSASEPGSDEGAAVAEGSVEDETVGADDTVKTASEVGGPVP